MTQNSAEHTAGPLSGIPTAFDMLRVAMIADPEYAWGWHCNLAMPIMDATGVSHEVANKAGAHLMQHLFGVDITKDARFVFEKSNAQQYAELRIAMDRDEDALLSERAKGGDA